MKFIISQNALQKIKDNFPADIVLELRSLEGNTYDHPDDLLLEFQKKIPSEDYNRYHIKLLEACKEPSNKDWFCLNIRNFKWYRNIDRINRSIVWIFIAILFVAGIYPYWILPIWIPENSPGGPGSTSFGTFGDSFGALNTLFSGLAFAGLIWTIVLQRKELQETRNEIKGQREQLANQYQVMKKDNFENTFFHLLSFHREIVDSMKFEENIDAYEGGIRSGTRTVVHNGGAFFDYMVTSKLYGFLENRYHAGIYPNLKPYERFYKTFDKYFSHYHKHLYQIMLFVEKVDFADSEKIHYLRLLRAQFSSNELLLLLFHCLSSYGREKFKPLLEKYQMLEHLPVDDHLKRYKEKIKKYDKSVFGDNKFYLEFYNS